MAECLGFTMPYSEYKKLSRFGKFKWFIMESKLLMGYDDYNPFTNGPSLKHKLNFWRRFPGSAYRYWRLSRNG